jgi:hypothetical protein
MNTSSWKHFIQQHSLSTQITWNTDNHNTIDLLQPSPTILTKDEEAIRLIKLASYPSIILLTLDPFNHSIFTSFHHDHLHNTSNPDPLNHQLVALTGFSNTAIPILLDLPHIFATTDTTHPTPTLNDFISMHDKTLEDLKTIPTIETNQHHIRKAITLPPFLNEVLFSLPSNPSPLLLLHSIIRFIKHQGDSRIPLTIIDEEDGEATDQAIPENIANQPPPTDWSFAEPLLPILISLWAFAHHDSIPHLEAKHTTASSDHATTWATQQHEAWFNTIAKNNHPPSFLRTPPRRRSNTDDDASTASSIDKLQDTLDAHARRFARADNNDDTPLSPPSKTNTDPLTKTWKTLDETFRQAILFASSPDGESAPSTPSERLIRIMQTKTGPTAAALIQRWHNPRLDLCIQPGMALHIIKGQLTSTPTPFSIDTFSPFFCPPTRVGFANLSNKELNEFELVAQSFNFSASDIKRMTACKPYIPTTAYIYIAQVRNFDAVLSDVLNNDCFIRAITTDIAIKHYELNQLMYHNIFDEHQHFGVWMLNRLHFKVQSILHQCYQVDAVTDIEFVKFSIQHELHQIDTLSFTADPPQWHKAELEIIRAKAEKAARERNTPWHELDIVRTSGQNQRKRGQHDHDNDTGHSDGKRIKVINENMNPSIRLQQGEVYSKLVHFQNLTKCKSAAAKYMGDFVCNNFHLRGHCFAGCKRSQSHTKLPQEIAAKYKDYVTALRKCRDSFENSRGHNNGHSNQDNLRNDRQGENDRTRS